MDNRTNILNCALELFANRGYDAVGVQEICEAAGITKPTLYHYFGSKHGLLQSLVEVHHRPFNRLIQEASACYNGSLPNTLEALARAYFRFAQENPVYVRLQLTLYFAPPHNEGHQVVETWNEQQYEMIEKLFETATREYGNMRGHQKVIATTFIGLMNTCIGLWLNGYTTLDEALVQRAVHQFQYGIYS